MFHREQLILSWNYSNMFQSNINIKYESVFISINKSTKQMKENKIFVKTDIKKKQKNELCMCERVESQLTQSLGNDENKSLNNKRAD